MTSRTLYEKRGGKYFPVLEQDIMSGGDVWENGCHLVVCKPGVRSTKFRIEPDEAPVLAALKIHSDELARLIQESSALEIECEQMNKSEIDSWESFQRSLGDKRFKISYPSSYQIANKFLELLRKKTIEE